jgi:hypothetical protein
MKDLALIADELDSEISERKELLTRLVGQLYPNILRDEIKRLQDCKFALIKK